jgi:hypothetical protein
MKQSFESYLEEKFMENFHGTKDEFENAYECWLDWQGIGMIIEMAEKWGKER